MRSNIPQIWLYFFAKLPLTLWADLAHRKPAHFVTVYAAVLFPLANPNFSNAIPIMNPTA